MIEIDHLTKKFPQITAVDDISFSVERGEVLGFLGPNGSGKSTTMKMITGFLTPTSGTARVAGFDVSKQPLEVKTRIGYLPEGAPAWPDMTPLALLTFCAEIRGYRGKEAAVCIADAVAKTQLSTVLQQPIETLSKGFHHRVGLAQALLHDPQVLILDEPTDGLDPNQKREVRELIKQMAGEKSIIISTHILEEVDAVCTRAIIIADGRIVSDGTPDQLAAKSLRHNGVRISVKGTTEKARTALAGIPEISGIDEEVDNSLFLTSKNQVPIVAAVGAALRKNKIDVEEIHVERGHLDDVFRAVTLGQ
jgi:ABC-2 type transport system ATP-binding protein